MDKTHPIIIKKKAGHGGHHGGAWKVAYADFVTAMMALFIVLWLLNTSKQIQEAVAGYFKDPAGTSKLVGNGMQGSDNKITVTKDDMGMLKQELQKRIRKMDDFEKLKNQIEITVTADGLRIELLETEKGTFFDSGSARVNDSGKELLAVLAQEMGKLPNQLTIEGHTDSKPYSGKNEYGNWELSADRANAARRLMQQEGVRPDQVSQVRGYADQLLRNKENPEDPSNRRISVIVHYLDKPEAAPTGAGEDPQAEKTPAKE